MKTRIDIRNVNESDANALIEIYNFYIKSSPATFEEIEISELEMRKRIRKISAEYPFFVLEVNNKIVAYAYASEWKSRSAYKFSCESSVYVHNDELGKSYGRKIYTHLIEQLKSTSYCRIIAGISLPNSASIELHESLGYKYIGTFHKVGYKQEEWIDVGYWELHL